MQTIVDGFQHEQPDYWLNFGNPWEIERLNVGYPIKFYGHVSVHEEDGRQIFRWNPGEAVRLSVAELCVFSLRQDFHVSGHDAESLAKSLLISALAEHPPGSSTALMHSARHRIGALPSLCRMRD